MNSDISFSYKFRKYFSSLIVLCIWSNSVNGSITTHSNSTNNRNLNYIKVNKCCESDEILVDNSCQVAKNFNECKYLS